MYVIRLSTQNGAVKSKLQRYAKFRIVALLVLLLTQFLFSVSFPLQPQL